MERRKHRRYLALFNNIVSTDGVRLGEGLVLNLSLGGCLLVTAIHVPSDIPIEIHIRPNHQSPICVLSAVVLWKRDCVCRFKFNELPKLESASLTRLLWTLRS